MANARQWERLFPAARLRDIDRAAIAHFITMRKDQGVTDTTIRRDLAFLGTVFTMAMSWEWAEANPVTALSKKFLKESPPRTRFLTRAEFTRLYAAASEKL